MLIVVFFVLFFRVFLFVLSCFSPIAGGRGRYVPYLANGGVNALLGSDRRVDVIVEALTGYNRR